MAENQLWLPDGVWYDFFTGFRYQGETKLTIYRLLEQMPVFVKEGAIIPLAGDGMATPTNTLPEVVEWHIFPGKNHEFEMVEDLKGKRVRTICTWDWKYQELKLEVQGDVMILPKERKHKIVLRSMEPIKSSVVGQGMCIETKSYKEIPRQQSFLIKPDAKLSLAIQFSGLKKIVKQAVSMLWYEVLDRAELNYTLKDDVWREVQKIENSLKGASLLNQLENKKLAAVLFEILY